MASHFDYAVLEFDGSTGAFVGTFITPGSGGLNGPQGILFTPDSFNIVPEPASIMLWSVVVVCFAAVGVGIRRRRWTRLGISGAV